MTSNREVKRPLYGLMAEFETPDALLAATQKAWQAGYRKMDAYTPVPIEGLAEALGFRKNRVPLLVLVGGVIGCIGGFSMQYYLSAINYPLNIGGRPLNSWPAFIPITFELTVLVAALFAVVGTIALNGLPMLYHPVFNVPRFQLASSNRFFLCIECGDPQFDRAQTKQFMEDMNSYDVSEVRN